MIVCYGGVGGGEGDVFECGLCNEQKCDHLFVSYAVMGNIMLLSARPVSMGT